ncbi:MAG: DNA polymerase III subunit delta [Candidatus Dormibacteraeota bacterium]|uniref:DNA-directed DNA polymerase n=1 Tax=Candidatus Dormiibacter inghamiae TaxID=3127013 RepID=A0A934KGF7_9BACT|nr:DNA polymerase III subunit delta [Candidatus Dormibacteraeota bacterium]MBJ7607733.1 DNA polymerase III subunit delta [Candidatus Dormibacteraeota bacterium]
MAGPVSVLLLHGDEQFLIDEEARRMLADWRRELVSDFGYEAVDSAGLNVDRLRDSVLQAPFLDPYRVVAVRGIAGRRADGLASGLNTIPDSTRLLLAVNGRLPSASKLLRAVVAAGGAVREYPPLKARALNEWVARRARELDLPAAAAATVARRARPDLAVLDSELHKLAAYRAGGYQLDQATIDELVVPGHPEEIFRLADTLLPRPSPVTWRVLDDLLLREPATTIAYRLSRHLALVLEVRTRQDRGETVSQVQAKMREHPFVVQKAYETARSVSAAQLEVGLRVFLDYEWEVKSGQIDSELGLSTALARL